MEFLHKFQDVIDKAPLADQSKQQYKLRLEKIHRLTKHDIDWVIDHPTESFNAIKKQVKEPETQRSLINAILAVFKYTDKLKEKKSKKYDKWHDLFDKVNEITERKYEQFEPSQKQIDVFVSWPDIIKARDQLDKSSQAYLLLCLYTMIPPSRADMNMLKIFHSQPTVTQIQKYPNYILINKLYCKIVYNEFKSKGKQLQMYEKVLPPELDAIVRKSIKDNPREFLIVSPRNGLPYENVNSFTKYFHRILFDVFQKKVTINTLRHSFVNSFDWNKINLYDKKTIAKDLMHSPNTMDRYRFFMPCSTSTCPTS